MLHENSRAYFFEPKDIKDDTWNVLEVQKVRKVVASKSGGHRLTCAGGALVYIPSGWCAIEIDSKRGWEQ